MWSRVKSLPARLSKGGLYMRESGLGSFTPNLVGNDGVARAVSAWNMDHDNLIINGDFSVNQNGLSWATGNQYCSDQWRMLNSGGTHSAQIIEYPPAYKLGNGSVKNVMRNVVNGGAASSDNAILRHPIERTDAFDNEVFTVLGWARRESGSGNMALEASRSGAGWEVVGVGTPVTLTNDWRPFAAVMRPTSVGSNPLTAPTVLNLLFWFSSGSGWGARNGGIGRQTITVDLWGIHTVRGEAPASAAMAYSPMPLTSTRTLCQRYLEKGTFFEQASGAGYTGGSLQFTTTKRAVPSVSRTIAAGSGMSDIALQSVKNTGFGFNMQAAGSGSFVALDWTADARL